MKTRVIFLFLYVAVVAQAQQTYKTVTDIPYIDDSETDTYRTERCKLDVYYPEGMTDFPTIVWYHGGGLEGGSKHIPMELMDKGFAVVTVNYRLSPRAQHPAYIEDAAEALAWVFEHIGDYGGNAEKIYVSGHSAGGYLALIIGLDKSYLAAHGVDADQVKAYLPISGQTVTHYTIRKERGWREGIPVIDAYAPCFHARTDTPPYVLITGGRDLELMARYEENALLESVMKGIGNPNVRLYELEGFDHVNVAGPACYLIAGYVRDLDTIDYIDKMEKK
ncbi:MAG: alpha/beta hydrolase [Bacteroides sp.]|nr:alpha/beta hydrolase [Bacteroides sp.]